jgi:two-component system chemotaxis sensor kinase CheA
VATRDVANGDLAEALAAAVMDADPEKGPANDLAELVVKARDAGILSEEFASEVDGLARALRTARPGEAIARISELLEDAETPKAPPPSEPTGAERADRDADTVDLVGDFLGESNEGLARADAILLALGKGTPEPDGTNALFRVFHTIKGVAGFLELREVVRLAHATESLLNVVREGRMTLSGAPFDLVLESTGTLRGLLDGVRKAVDERANVAPDPVVPGLVARLEKAVAAAPAEAGEPAASTSTSTTTAAAKAGTAAAPKQAPAAKPTPTAPATPTATATPTPTPTPTATATATATPTPTPTPTAAATPTATRAQPAAPPAAAPAAAPAPSAAAPAPTAAGPAIRETVKVDLERVNTMLEMIGELIIVESMVAHAPELAQSGNRRLKNDLNQLAKISRDLQGVAMRMRMVPVRGVFGKMARLVHDLSRRTGKDVVLETSGEDTELDRSMVERLEDPLVHLVRNGIDHGVEAPDARRAAGKPPRATLRLSAFHEGGSVVVELADDGRGLQREKILARARDRKLVDPARELSDDEVNALIFLPGFSTAETVSEISGRGVGMDVVKRGVEALRGRVGVASRPGHGTTFRLTLPLTLAIIDGMLVICGTERYIIPSLSIMESLRPTSQMVSRMPGKGELLSLRGEVLPLLRLRALLELDGAELPLEDSRVVVVEGLGRKVALLLDDVVAQQQVVIKPLGAGVGDADVFSGAAILSDGRVGLILNVDRLAMRAARTVRPRAPAEAADAAARA